MRMRALGWLIPAGLLVLAAGCERSGDHDKTLAVSGGDGGRYLLTEEPPDAKGVLEVKKSAKDGDEVRIVGRVGGRRDPFLNGRVGFTLVDSSLKPCDERPDDDCKTPWDYCCESSDDLAKATVLVKIVSEKGTTVEGQARDLLGVEPLNTLVVRGKAKRDADGNLTVLASGVFIRR